MEEELSGNVLVMQLGCNSAVSNSVLAGIVNEALNYECIEEIFGSVHGIRGILNNDFIDLASESQQVFRDLQFTPGAALGTSDWKQLTIEECERIHAIFNERNIRYLFVIGGTYALSCAHQLTQFMEQKNYEIRIIGIPETSQNNIAVTDHCLGYGSAAKNIAYLVQELSVYGRSQGNHDLVLILEVKDEGAGWLVASAELANGGKNIKDSPVSVFLPQLNFSVNHILEKVQSVLSTNPFRIFVVPSIISDEEGNPLNEDGTSAAWKLKSIIESELDVKVEVSQLGIAQNFATSNLSQVDQKEAFACGSKSVSFAMDGISGKMITILRSEKMPYSTEFSVADLENVIEKEKEFNSHWISEEGVILNNFRKYLSPLIQGQVDVSLENGLPHFANLSY